MIKVGITGQSGFIGTHLYNAIGLDPIKYERVPFKKEYFSSMEHLANFISQCDVIIHLAAMNRHWDSRLIYQTNVELVEKLVSALEATKSKAHVLFSSSIQEEKCNEYGKSKLLGREILYDWSLKSGGTFTGLIIPNVFGPFANPFYNSVVATFCHQLSQNENPKIENDSDLKLIYVSELVSEIIKLIHSGGAKYTLVRHTKKIKVSNLLSLLSCFKSHYLKNGIIPTLKSSFELNLFNTFRSYIDVKNHFPVKIKKNVDLRGTFIEIARLNVGGQISFSTTMPGVTRGNHFHTRKIERFAVIKGKALIRLRHIGSDQSIDFYLDGEEPSYVDMPIWCTHNIKNIGEDDLFTVFWINEFYNPNDHDTYFETV